VSRPRSSKAFAWLGGFAVLCALLALPANQASAAKGKPPEPLFWGAQIGKQLTGESAPWDMRALDEFERHARKSVSVLSFPSPFADDCSDRRCEFFPFPVGAMDALRQRGTIPMLSWASQSVPSKLREPAFQLSDIIRGTYDSYIQDFARQVDEWGHPFFLRFNPEMNGFWFPWGESVNGNRPGQFVKAWRHVHNIFTSMGATNATWVWCPNVDFTRKLTPLHGLYPGGRYVDWTCLDGFNWGGAPNSGGWQSFDEIFRSTYHRVIKIAPRKPMVIAETAAEERGGSKAGWIRATLRAVTKYPKIRGLIWFEENDRSMRWPIESSVKARNAFADAIQRTVFRPGEFSGIESIPIAPPSWPS